MKLTRQSWLRTLMASACAIAATGQALAAAPISVATGPGGYKRFVAGEVPYRAIGVNYLIEHYGAPYKTFDMFDTHTFNRALIDENLKAIAQDGFTFVRLWLKGLDPDAGFGLNGRQIGEAYAENVLLTLQDARRYGLRVVLTGAFNPAIWVPRNYLPARPLPDDSVVAGMNRLILIPQLAQANGAFFADLLRWLKSKDADILSTIFYIDMYNELHFELNKAPFNRYSGQYVFQQHDYDLGDSSSRQRLMDRATEAWLRQVAAGVKAVDPRLLVTASTNLVTAFGHSGFDGGIQRKPGGKLNAYPVRPDAIIEAGMDLLDIHIYPSAGRGGMSAFHERAEEMFGEGGITETTAREIPLIAGEFGAERDKFNDPETGARELLETEGVMCQLHFTGFAVWAWNGTDATWTLDDAPLRYAMAPRLHPPTCYLAGR